VVQPITLNNKKNTKIERKYYSGISWVLPFFLSCHSSRLSRSVFFFVSPLQEADTKYKK